VPPLDLSKIKTYPIAQRRNLVHLNDLIDPDAPPPFFEHAELEAVAQQVIAARQAGCPVIWMMGAHVIKSGLSRILIRMMEQGIITHVAGNGAVSIHDFELCLIGETSEDVAESLEDGSFGMAEETSALMHQAIQEGARDGLGYGAALGRFIDRHPARFPQRAVGVLYNAYRLGIPATIHVTIGTDIIHQHPKADFAAIGAASGRDFHQFAGAVSELEGGVFLNFGSAVTGPEVFLKALTMARNLGYPVRRLTTANFDLRPLPDYHAPVSSSQPDYYYRPRKNIINRPTMLGGQGYHIQGDHVLTIPNLFHKVAPALAGLKKAAPITAASSRPAAHTGQVDEVSTAPRLSRADLQALLNRFSGLRVGVIGDLGLDAYWQIDMTRAVLSRETPLFPRPVITEQYGPGAGGNVANNLRALGAGQVRVFSVIGPDGWGDLLLNELDRLGIDTRDVLRAPGRRTTTYIKPILNGYNSYQEDARFDFENTHTLTPQDETDLLERLESALPDLDALIIIDQLDQQGVITPTVRDRLNALAARFSQVTWVVDSRRNIAHFTGMALKPNWVEAVQAGKPGADPRATSLEELAGIGEFLSQLAGQAVFITLSEKGVLVCRDQHTDHLPAAPVTPPLDPVGAGDTFIAGLACSLASGASHGQAAQLAGLASAVTVEKLHTTGTASPDEILARYAMSGAAQ
jgi:rfaE bifunctional protein kinase chain/domain